MSSKKKKNLKALRIKGGSMSPFLKRGDIVVVDINDRDISNFDLATFIRGKELITHFTLKRGNSIFFFPANKKYVEGPVEKNRIIGKARGIKKGKFYFPIFIFKPIFKFYFHLKGIK